MQLPPPPSFATSQHPAARAARAALVAAIVAARAYVAFLLIANLALGCGAVEWLVSGNGQERALTLGRAYTLWPGVVHVRDLGFRFQDSNVEFAFTLARAEVHLAPRELLARTFRATRLRGDGLHFVFRHKIVDVEAAAPRLAGYPPIPGFADPPRKRVGPEEPVPATDADYHLWTVRLDDVDVDLAELWIMEYRWEGHGRVRGRMNLRPMREVEVGPATLTLEPGSLGFGRQAIGRAFGGTIACTVHTFDPRMVKGLEPLRAVDAKVVLAGELTTLAFVSAYLGPRPAVTIAEGAGHLDVDATLAGGRVAPGSRATLATPRLVATLERAGVGLAGDARVAIRAVGAPDAPRLAASLAAHETTLLAKRTRATDALAAGAPATAARAGAAADLAKRPGAADAAKLPAAADVATLEDVALDVGLDRADLAGDLAVAEARASVGTARARDLARLWTLVGGDAPSLRVERGAAEGHVAAAYARGAFSGDADVAVAGLAVSSDGLRVAGDARARTRVTSATLAGPFRASELTVALDGATVAAGGRTRSGWWARAAATDATLTLAPSTRIAAAIGLRCKDGEPLLDALVAKGAVPRELAALVPMPELTARLRVLRDRAGTELVVDEARSGVLGLSGSMRAPEGRGPDGVLVLRAGPVPVRIELQDGQAKVVPFAG